MKLLGLLGVVLLICSSCSCRELTEDEANEKLIEFYNDNVPEPIITRILEEAGAPIVPFLSKEVQNRNMPKREYAILALGDIGDKRALPSLTRIFQDLTESPVTRGDALRSIWHINKSFARILIENFGEKEPYIVRTIQLLEAGQL